MEEGLPADDELLARARRMAPRTELDKIRSWLSDFRDWIGVKAIADVLSLGHYTASVHQLSMTRVERELPFLHRTDGGILQGYVDRLVLVEEDGSVVRADVLDFKTDEVIGSDAMSEKVAYYRPQIDAYREAVAGRYGLELSAVSGKLLFLRLGVVREV